MCCESEGGHEAPPFYFTSGTEDFFDYLDGLTVDEYNDERRVIVIFHNFKGYDAMFVLQYLYANCHKVSAQICIGTKVLSLKSGNLTFKDSLCFPPFSLASFSSTFDIKEHKKGFFPIYLILWRIKVMRDLPLIHAPMTLTGCPRTRKGNS